MSYYLIDAGDEMAELALGTYEALKKLEHHVVLYCTDQAREMTITLIEEDQFLDHFKNFNNET